MPDALITVDNVSKKFCRSLKRSLWYGVKDLSCELTGRSNGLKALRKHEFWALRDVSFELRRGECLGLIGRNGAGKTTLLRILNGLIKPDAGRIEVRGRMQALIALGAGFNPILTGRENIYVNAAVLGIPKAEVRRRFDHIVDFSGIEDFIDTPVQSYSSGMAVRLGFAVAAHMEPDILLVDEVLAVGDVPFRVRCHKKLGELKAKGIPWILVSHDMGTIRNQANKVIFLDDGKIRYIGSPEEAISRYLLSTSERTYLEKKEKAYDRIARPSGTSREAEIKNVFLLDTQRKRKDVFETGESVIIQIDYFAHHKVENPSFGVAIYDGEGNCYMGNNTTIAGYAIDYINGSGTILCKIDHLPLLSGFFRLRVDIVDKSMGMLDSNTDAACIRVQGGKFGIGMFYVGHSWEIVNYQ